MAALAEHHTDSLYMKGRRVGDGWCMCLVGHGYVRLADGRNGGGGRYAGHCRRLVACREMPDDFLSVRRYTDDTAIQVASSG